MDAASSTRTKEITGKRAPPAGVVAGYLDDEKSRYRSAEKSNEERRPQEAVAFS
jgi:hypothetical protein